MIYDQIKSIFVKTCLFLACASSVQCESEPEMVHVRYINESSSTIDTFSVDNTVYYTTWSSFIVGFEIGDTSDYFSFEDNGFKPFYLIASSSSKRFHSSFRYGIPDSVSTSFYGAGYYDVIIEYLDTLNNTIAFNIEQK